MKPIASLVLALTLPLLAFAQQTPTPAAAPANRVLSSYRILAKPGHEMELKAALAAHAAKYHRGDHAWRVAEVLSGPDGGMYHIIEGPTSWTALDDRGDLGSEHMKDYATTVLPHVEKSTPNSYAVFQPELSTVGATDYSNKVLSVHITVKPGHSANTIDALKHWKAIYQRVGYNIAVWHLVGSGENTYVLVRRLKAGLKDLDQDTSTRKAAADLYGPDEWARLQQEIADDCLSAWTEMTEFHPELSSPAPSST